MDSGAPPPPKRSSRSASAAKPRSAPTADPRVESTTGAPRPSSGRGLDGAAKSYTADSAVIGVAPNGARPSSRTSKRSAAATLVEPTVSAPDAPPSDLAEPVVVPRIVPAEPDEPMVVPGAAILAPPASPDIESTLEVTALVDTLGSEPSAAPRAQKPPASFRRRARVRRVTRIIRHVDTWSVFKVALVFNVFFYLACLTSGVLLWQVAYATGTIDNIEKFFEGFGWSSFQFRGGEIYHNAWIGGLFVAIGFTGLAVLMATLFNLITDLVGGIRVSVLEEEVVARIDRSTMLRGLWASASGTAEKRAEPTESTEIPERLDQPQPG